MKVTYSELMDRYATKAIKRQESRSGRHVKPSIYSISIFIKVGICAASLVTIGAIGYFLVFWVALKCGIEI